MRFSAIDITAELWYDDAVPPPGNGTDRQSAGKNETVYNVHSLCRLREIDHCRDYRGKLSDKLMRMRAIVRLLLVDLIVYTIQYNLALSASEC